MMKEKKDQEEIINNIEDKRDDAERYMSRAEALISLLMSSAELQGKNDSHSFCLYEIVAILRDEIERTNESLDEMNDLLTELKETTEQ